jgi:head-tail adaptor
MASIPRAQEMNQSIIFQTKAGARNAVTGVAAAPVTYATAWARVTEQGGNVEQMEQSSEAQMQQYEIWCRYNSGVTGFMQILWGTRQLLILGPPMEVKDSNNRRWMVIQAQETTEN